MVPLPEQMTSAHTNLELQGWEELTKPREVRAMALVKACSGRRPLTSKYVASSCSEELEETNGGRRRRR